MDFDLPICQRLCHKSAVAACGSLEHFCQDFDLPICQRPWHNCCSFGSCTTWGPPQKGYIVKFFRQILSTPFRPKIDQNGLKTTPRGVGRASRGIGQLLAPSSSNMSPWGLMADPFKPIFIDFRTFFENLNRYVRNSFRKNEFLVAPLAKVLRGI